MPKRRMIDPSLWTSESLATLPIEQRYLFIGLFSNADDQGRLRAHPALVRNLVFPYENPPLENVQTGLDALDAIGSILLYDVDGKTYLQILGWWDYQKPAWAYPSDIPAPDGWQDRLRYREDNQVKTHNWNGQLESCDQESESDNALGKDLGKALGKDLPVRVGKDLPTSLGKPSPIATELELELELDTAIEKDTAVGSEKSPPVNSNFNSGSKPRPKSELKDEFLLITGLKMPRRKTDEKFWWSSIAEIYEISGRDVDIGKKLIHQSVTKLKTDHLTIAGPESLIKTCRALMATPPSEQPAESQKQTFFDDLPDDQDAIQAIAQIVKIDLGGDGNAARRARSIYYEHPDWSHQKIARAAIGVDQ